VNAKASKKPAANVSLLYLLLILNLPFRVKVKF